MSPDSYGGLFHQPLITLRVAKVEICSLSMSILVFGDIFFMMVPNFFFDRFNAYVTLPIWMLSLFYFLLVVRCLKHCCFLLKCLFLYRYNWRPFSNLLVFFQRIKKLQSD
jgi:hypothetical protein